MPPNRQVGQKLRRFYGSLLGDPAKMLRYHGTQAERTALVNESIRGNDAASQEARRALLQGTQQEVEAHITADGGSLDLIVWPPM